MRLSTLLSSAFVDLPASHVYSALFDTIMIYCEAANVDLLLRFINFDIDTNVYTVLNYKQSHNFPFYK